MSTEGNICDYIIHRDKNFYIGSFLIPLTSLCIIPELQRPYDEAQARKLQGMYTNRVDMRSIDPLECVVMENRDQFDNWFKDQDHTKLSMLQAADMLKLDLPGIAFPIIKGQHRYKAYLLAQEENLLLEDVPHPDCLVVRLYHLGEPSGSSTLTYCS